MRQQAQAIVLAAGPGSRMTSVGFKAKCLLPVGVYPMIFYPLKLLQDSGFDEATVIVSQKDERELKSLNEVYGLKLRLDLVPVDTSSDPGTAESLKHIENKIKKDVDEIVIVSSDLITDVSLLKMINCHQSRGAALTILTASQNSEYVKALPPGPKSKAGLNNDIICTEEGGDRLAYYVAGGDYEDHVAISNRILSAFENGVDLATDIADGHLYIMKRWVVDYILHNDSSCAKMGSLKAEVIPHLIAEQFAKTASNESAMRLQKFMKTNELEELICKYNTSTVPSRFQLDSNIDARVCYTFHHNGLCVRVNTMGTLWQVNRKVNDICEALKLPCQKYVKGSSTDINEKAQICADSVIGRGTKISEKTNITNSVLGKHCRISPMVRISNSVLFDYVQVEEGCVIENSLIGVNVEKRCTIRNCILTDVSKISENGNYENEILEKGLSQDY